MYSLLDHALYAPTILQYLSLTLLFFFFSFGCLKTVFFSRDSLSVCIRTCKWWSLTPIGTEARIANLWVTNQVAPKQWSPASRNTTPHLTALTCGEANPTLHSKPQKVRVRNNVLIQVEARRLFLMSSSRNARNEMFVRTAFNYCTGTLRASV